jgi:hypothetical protein
MGDATDIVGAYLGHLADHSLQAALACLAPDFELEFAGAGFTLGKGQAATALEWDVGANGRLDWQLVDASLHTVTIQGSEGNDFLDLIGVGRLAFRSVFTVSPSGLISRQVHEVSWGEVSLSEAMIPLTTWASEHESEELAEIYPGEQMTYSRQMAVRWVRLAEKWKGATSS